MISVGPAAPPLEAAAGALVGAAAAAGAVVGAAAAAGALVAAGALAGVAGAEEHAAVRNRVTPSVSTREALRRPGDRFTVLHLSSFMHWLSSPTRTAPAGSSAPAPGPGARLASAGVAVLSRGVAEYNKDAPAVNAAGFATWRQLATWAKLVASGACRLQRLVHRSPRQTRRPARLPWSVAPSRPCSSPRS